VTITDNTLSEVLSAAMVAMGWDTRKVMSFLVEKLSVRHDTVAELIEEFEQEIISNTRPDIDPDTDDDVANFFNETD
jgi:hypothetical protein